MAANLSELAKALERDAPLPALSRFAAEGSDEPAF